MMVDLSVLTFEEVLNEDFHIDYASKLSSIYIDLHAIELNLRFSQQILANRPEVFPPYSTRALFLNSYLENALRLNIMTIIKLVSDSGSDSLNRFRNEVRRNTSQKYLSAMQERLRLSRLDSSLQDDIHALRRRRNEQIAHNREIALYAGDVPDLLVGQQLRLLNGMKQSFAATVFSNRPVEPTFDSNSLSIEVLLSTHIWQ